MFDQTNQTTETNSIDTDTNVEMPETLFGDDDVEVAAEPETTADAEPATEDKSAKDDAGAKPAEAEPEVDADKEGAKPGETVRIKYNGEEKEIPLSEAVQLAQKGMNYDHVKEELEQYKSGAKSAYDREIGLLDSFAKRSGLTREEYIAHLEQGAASAEVEELVDELQSKYPDAPPDMLRRMAELEAKEQQARRALEEQQRERDALDRRTKPWRDLVREFPDVNVAALPEAVLKAVEAGRTPIEAYQAHLLEEAQKQAKIAEQHGYNKARAVGSVRGDAAEPDRDPFLEGFGAAD